MATKTQQAAIDKIGDSDVRLMVQTLADRWPDLLIDLTNEGRRVFVGTVDSSPVLFASHDTRGAWTRKPTPDQFARLLASMDAIEQQTP